MTYNFSVVFYYTEPLSVVSQWRFVFTEFHDLRTARKRGDLSYAPHSAVPFFARINTAIQSELLAMIFVTKSCTFCSVVCVRVLLLWLLWRKKNHSNS